MRCPELSRCMRLHREEVQGWERRPRERGDPNLFTRDRPTAISLTTPRRDDSINSEYSRSLTTSSYAISKSGGGRSHGAYHTRTSARTNTTSRNLLLWTASPPRRGRFAIRGVGNQESLRLPGDERAHLGVLWRADACEPHVPFARKTPSSTSCLCSHELGASPGHVSPTLVDIGPSLIISGPNLADSGPILVEPNLAEVGPSLPKARPDLVEIQTKLPVSTKSWSKLISTFRDNFGRFRAKVLSSHTWPSLGRI